MGPLPMLGMLHADDTLPPKFWVELPPVENDMGPLLSTGPSIWNAPFPVQVRPELPQPPRVSRAGPGKLVTAPTATPDSRRVVPPRKSAPKKLGAMADTVTDSCPAVLVSIFALAPEYPLAFAMAVALFPAKVLFPATSAGIPAETAASATNCRVRDRVYRKPMSTANAANANSSIKKQVTMMTTAPLSPDRSDCFFAVCFIGPQFGLSR